MVGVVLSAAFILGGTCAALIPSGVMTLIQVAFVLIIALLLLSVAAMPVFLTALKQLASKLNGSSNGATSKNVVEKVYNYRLYLTTLLRYNQRKVTR